jgi:hypothetical protein
MTVLSTAFDRAQFFVASSFSSFSEQERQPVQTYDARPSSSRHAHQRHAHGHQPYKSTRCMATGACSYSSYSACPTCRRPLRKSSRFLAQGTSKHKSLKEPQENARPIQAPPKRLCNPSTCFNFIWSTAIELQSSRGERSMFCTL